MAPNEVLVCDPSFVFLYVQDIPRAVAFWTRLLGRPPAQASPGFAMWPLGSGMMLGVWDLHEAGATGITGGGGELAVVQPGPVEVDALHARWAADGVTILQPPVDLPFGHAFLAADPEGHRIRVFSAPK